MHIGKSIIGAWFGALSLLAAAAAQAQDAGSAMEGQYTLVSSTTRPAGLWKYTKARIEVTRHEQRYLLISMACSWADEPKAACDDWWTAQIRAGGVYLQDRNTDHVSLRFDPSAHTITVTSEAVDAARTVRTDVFQRDQAPTSDKALIRRMKSAYSSADGTWKRNGVIEAKKWTYARATIAIGPQ
jgi:hypothetical protein